MSTLEAAFCRSWAWRGFARRTVLPWALDDRLLAGDVLEIGGGSGAMAAGIARTYPDVRLTVTDFDPAMVASARQGLTAYPSMAVDQADVTALPYAADSFDIVASFLMLHHVVEWPAALTEAARVLRPGGRLAGYDLTATRLARLIHRADGSPHRLIDPSELEDRLRLSGLADVVIETSLASHVMRFTACKPKEAARA